MSFRFYHIFVSLWSGRSGASSIAQNFAIRVALLFVNFGTGVIVARALAPVGRGEQAAISLWPLLFAGLATMGIPIALNYQSRRRPSESARLYFVAAFTMVMVGFVAAAIGAIAMPHLLRGYDHRLIREAEWLMLFTPPFLLTYVVRAYLESRGEFLRSMLGQFLPNVFILVALVLLFCAHRLTPESSALAYLLPFAIQTFWVAGRLSRSMEIRPRQFVGDVRVLFGYGLRCYGSDIVAALSTQLDLAVIVGFLTPVALGLYTVALALTRLLFIVQQPVVMVLFPRASGLECEDAIELVARAARLTTLGSALLGIVLLLVVPVALPLVYGSAFAPAIGILPLLVAEAGFSGLSWVLMQAFLATGRPAVATIIQAAWLLITLALLLVLVPRMNIAGAATALFASSVARVMCILLAYRIVLGRAPPRLIPDATDFAYLHGRLRAFNSRRPALLKTG